MRTPVAEASRIARAVAAAGIVTAIITLSPPAPAIDANRVVVFPLYDAGVPVGSSDAEAVATYIGNALSNAPPLTWVDGWELVGDSAQRRLTASASWADLGIATVCLNLAGTSKTSA